MRAETDRQQFSLAQEASRLPIENSLTLVIWSLGVALAYHGSCNVQPLSRTDHCFPALPGAVFFWPLRGAWRVCEQTAIHLGYSFRQGARPFANPASGQCVALS